jgi:hypothetical protein
MIFNKYSEEEIRSFSRQSLETLEYWLRQVVDESLRTSFGSEYLAAKDKGGSSILSVKRVDQIKERQKSDKERYRRIIDAALLDDLISIICHPNLYNSIFSEYFNFNYPNGSNELRTTLNRLIDPRNRLSHANPITHRQAQQVICYSNDIIDSIKHFYLIRNMHSEFNVPRIIKYKDSFGNEIFFDKNVQQPMVNFQNSKEFYLRPGDTLDIEVEIDSSFKEDEYSISWRAIKKIPNFGNTKKISIQIEEHHIGVELNLQCLVTSNKSWHRLSEGCDDLLLAWYKVLPVF